MEYAGGSDDNSACLGVPKSTYYRWKKPSQGAGERCWRQARNRLTSEEEATVLAVAREMPEWRSRQLAAWLTDQKGLAVSESTVYRLLRREGLVKAAERQLLAGKEYQHKTTGPAPAVGHRRLLLPGRGATTTS